MGAVLDHVNGKDSGKTGGGGGYVEGGDTPAGLTTIKASSGGGGGGFFGGLGKLVHEAVAFTPNTLIGLGHLTGQVGRDVYRFRQHTVDSTAAGAGGSSYDEQLARVREASPRLRSDFDESFVADLGRSFQRTGGDIAHPSRFGKAYSHGHLIGKLVEDIANASIVGSAISKPLSASARAAEEGAVALEKAQAEAATRVEKAAATESEATATAHEAARAGPNPLADAQITHAARARAEAEAALEHANTAAETARARATRIAQLAEHMQGVQKLAGKTNPIELAGKGVKAAAGGAIRGLAGIEEGSRAASIPGAATASKAASVLQGFGREYAEGRLAHGLLRQHRFEQARELAPIRSAGIERANLLGDAGTEAASTLVHLDQRARATVGGYQRLVDAGAEDLAAEFVDRQAAAEGVAPEHLRLAYEALDPQVQTPEVVAARERMAAAAEVYRGQQAVTPEQMYLEMRGEPTPGPALAEYRRKSLGDEPLFGDTAAEAALIKNAPKRWRPLLRSGVAATQVLDDMAASFARDGDTHSAGLLAATKKEIITTLDQATAAGLDPAFVQGGEIAPGVGGVPATYKLPKVKATGSSKFGSGEHQPVTVADQTRLMLDRAKKITENEGAARIQRSALGTTVAEAAAEVGLDAATMSNRELVQFIRDEKLHAWNPADPLGTLRSSEITADTPLIPRSVFTVYKQVAGPAVAHGPIAGTLLKGYDLATKGFVTQFLYLSPRWFVSQVIGNSIMATAGAGLNVGEFLHSTDRAMRIVRGTLAPEEMTAAERSLLGPRAEPPPELIGRGQAGVDAPTLGKLTPGKTGIGRNPIRWTQKAVAFTDDTNRVAIALAKVEKGLTEAEATAYRQSHPELADIADHRQLVNEYAIRESLRAIGDYSDLSVIEREAVGRVILFYPWLRHITRLAFDLNVHHPLRVAWALHLADLYGVHNKTTLTRGQVPLGDQWWEHLPNPDPFANLFSPFGATGTGQSPLQSLNPVIKAGAAGLNIDIGRGQLLKGPPGFGPLDDQARPSFGLIGARQFANYLGQQSPQIRALATTLPQLIGREPVIRYPTGEPYGIEGETKRVDASRFAPFSGGGSLTPLLNLFGIPYATQIDEDSLLKRIEARRRQLEAQREAYLRATGG